MYQPLHKKRVEMFPALSEHLRGDLLGDSGAPLWSRWSKSQIRKRNHNAGERDRRKRISHLYSTLKGLLPPDEQSGKLSMPATVSRVVKYIPELQREVKELEEKRETLFSKLSPQEGDFCGRESSDGPSISAARIGDEEATVQITVVGSQKGLLAEAMMHVEMEGFVVLNASCFQSYEGRSFLTLHLKGEGTQLKDQEMLERKLKALLFTEKMEANTTWMI